MKEPYVYILANQPYGTLYIGVTSDLLARLMQHRTDALPGFTRQYGVHMLVRYEPCDTMEQAIGLGLPPLSQAVPRDGC
jgi:putative endonuclease